MINKSRTFSQFRKLIINRVCFNFKVRNTLVPSCTMVCQRPQDRYEAWLEYFVPGVYILTHCSPGHQAKGDHFTQAVGCIGVHLPLFWTYVLSNHRVLGPASSMRTQRTGVLLPCRAISVILYTQTLKRLQQGGQLKYKSSEKVVSWSWGKTTF